MISESDEDDPVLGDDNAAERNNKKASSVWDHFIRQDANSAMCKYCKKSLKTNTSSTSGLLRHLKSAHAPKFQAMQQKTPKAHDKSTKQPPLTTFFHGRPMQSTDAQSKRLTKKIGEMLALSYLPYQFVESVGFRNLMREAIPNYTVPSRTTFSRSVVPELYRTLKEEVCTKLTSDLAAAETSAAITITTDMWTSRNGDPYICITVHYVSPQLDLIRFTLANSYFPGDHSGARIHAKLGEILEDWNINSCNHIFVVTDNAANLRGGIARTTWKPIQCFAHTLQLAIADTKKDHQQVTTLLAKARAIVGHYSRSTAAEERRTRYQRDLTPVVPQHKLIQDVDTRWNSEFLMLERLVEQRSNITAELATSTTSVNNLTGMEWEMASALVLLLRPLYDATTELCSEVYPTLSMVIPILDGIESYLTHFISNTGSGRPTGVGFARTLLRFLKSRFPNVRKDTVVVLSMLVDPRFKLLVLPDPAKASSKLMLKQAMIDASTATDTARPTVRDPAPVPCSHTAMSLWTSFDQRTSSSTSGSVTQTESVEEELDHYLREPVVPRKDDPLKWWASNDKRFPLVFHVAKIYLGIPATQVSSERVFSTAGNIVTTRRETLSTSHVEQLTFIHDNLIFKYNKH